jgi:hypothetical protein
MLRMTQSSKWIVLSLCIVAASSFAVWFASGLMQCQYSESSLSYSPDHKFYTQLQYTLCKDPSKSHVQLIMGGVEATEKSVLLDLGPSVGEVQYQWRDGPELHIQAPGSAIKKRYGPYEKLPRVVLTYL